MVDYTLDAILQPEYRFAEYLAAPPQTRTFLPPPYLVFAAIITTTPPIKTATFELCLLLGFNYLDLFSDNFLDKIKAHVLCAQVAMTVYDCYWTTNAKDLTASQIDKEKQPSSLVKTTLQTTFLSRPVFVVKAATLTNIIYVILT